jgi:hypothetical protein
MEPCWENMANKIEISKHNRMNPVNNFVERLLYNTTKFALMKSLSANFDLICMFNFKRLQNSSQCCVPFIAMPYSRFLCQACTEWV